jgi:hypothetical protein
MHCAICTCVTLCTMHYAIPQLYNSRLKLEYLLDVVGGLKLQKFGVGCDASTLLLHLGKISFETWVQIF